MSELMDLNLNSIFEMLPEAGKQMAYLSDRDPLKSWSEGKRVWVRRDHGDRVCALTSSELLAGVAEWELSSGRAFDAMVLTEADAIKIIEKSIKIKKQKC